MLLNKLADYQLVLASSSPRRKELMNNLDLNFEVLKLDYKEDLPAGISGKKAAFYLAGQKAAMVQPILKSREIAVVADTIVCAGKKLLGKPSGPGDAAEMLRLLSGRKHKVITGVGLVTQTEKHCFASSTTVVFGRLDREEIEYYIRKFEPYDKAGAYGIQEWIGHIGVESIRGSYFNVMGLPVQKLYRELKIFAQKINH